jgi:hypothetical protein
VKAITNIRKNKDVVHLEDGLHLKNIKHRCSPSWRWTTAVEKTKKKVDLI